MNDPAVYNKIGKSYDKTRSADPQIVSILEELLHPNQQGKYLDIGCGSGNYSIALSELAYHFTGIDVSEEMLGKARSKSSRIKWLKQDARDLQFADEQFDGSICILATHHIQDLDKAFAEVYRVLKPGSIFILFTSTPEQMAGYWLNHYFPNMMIEGVKIMASELDLSASLQQAGFSQIKLKKYFVSNELQDWFLHSGKYQPEIYFDPVVRAGISSFAKATDQKEIQEGLWKIKIDIENKSIDGITNHYENNMGDYLFLAATK